MAWKPVVQVQGEGDKWHRNGLVFATREEALDNARDLYTRWTLTTAYNAEEVDEPVNYKWVDYKLEPVEKTNAGE